MNLSTAPATTMPITERYGSSPTLMPWRGSTRIGTGPLMPGTAPCAGSQTIPNCRLGALAGQRFQPSTKDGVDGSSCVQPKGETCASGQGISGG